MKKIKGSSKKIETALNFSVSIFEKNKKLGMFIVDDVGVTFYKKHKSLPTKKMTYYKLFKLFSAK